MDRLFALDGMAEAHEYSVACHRSKIEELKARDDYAAFYAELTSERMETLSRLHYIFGRATYTAGSGGDPGRSCPIGSSERLLLSTHQYTSPTRVIAVERS